MPRPRKPVKLPEGYEWWNDPDIDPIPQNTGFSLWLFKIIGAIVLFVLLSPLTMCGGHHY